MFKSPLVSDSFESIDYVAKSLSRKHPTDTYCVLDFKSEGVYFTVCRSVALAAFMTDCWHVVAAYRNGEEVEVDTDGKA